MFCRCAFYLCLVIAVGLTQTGFSQESDTAPAEQSEFASLLAEWKDLDKQMIAAQAEYDAADGDVEQQDEIRKDFQILVDQANDLVEELKTAALAEFETEPNNREVVRTLMGIVMNDANDGQDEDALELGQTLIEGGINPRFFEAAAASETATIPVKELFEELLVRQAEAKAGDLPRAKLITSKGEIIIELFENESPATVGNFISLVKDGFYKDIKFHRVISGFMAQTGCPEGTGSGGPGYKIYDECTNPEARRHFTGSLSMAKENPPHTGGSQFFLTFSRTNHLDGVHTVFGRVVSGMDVLRTLTVNHTFSGPIAGQESDMLQSVEIIRDRGHEYMPNKVEDGADEDAAPEPDAPKTQPDNAGSASKVEAGEAGSTSKAEAEIDEAAKATEADDQ